MMPTQQPAADPLAPYSLGSLNLKNRFVLAPMTTYSSQPDGNISADELSWLGQRAEGFGLVLTACAYVHPSGKAFAGQWACNDDAFLPSLKSAAEVIRQAGSLSALQIHHGGRACPPELCGGTPVSASAIPAERPNAVTPRELSEPEILELIDAYGQAARRAKEAGFDSVEIHGANTYLIQQFVSPHSNRRTDSWNADALRFPREVIKAVRVAVGPDYPVGYRFSPEEIETPGIRMDRTEKLIDLLLEHDLAWIHVSLRSFTDASSWDEDKTPLLKRVAEQIKGRTPVIGVGSIKSLEDSQSILSLGADLIAVARTAITDPEFVQHIASGAPVKTKLPRGDFRESLSIPNGLYQLIQKSPGWIEQEAETESAV